MSDSLVHRRGQLRERIAAQRSQLARETRPLLTQIARVDRTLNWARRAINVVKGKPYLLAGAMASLWVIKPRRLWQVTRWGLAAWRQVAWWRARQR